MKLLDMFNIGNESIDFQTSSFGKELENALSIIRETYKEVKDIYDCPEKRIFEKVVKKHTGLNITLNFNTDIPAATSVPDLTNGSILIHNARRHYLTSNDALVCLKASKKDKNGNLVDIKRARVSGQFAELNNVIYVSGVLFLKDFLTIQEYVAILLHEIGHIFVAFEYVNRTTTNNQVMASVVRTVMEKNNVKEREIIFKEASEILGVKDDRILELEKITDARVISTVILKWGVDNTVSELGMQEYDMNSFEQLADQFSTRQGYGRHLITGLDKLVLSMGSPERSIFHTFFYFIFESWMQFKNAQSWYYTFMRILGGAVSFVLLYNAFYLTLILLSAIKLAGAKNKDYTYDILRTRYLRVREQLIQRLKNKSIPSTESKNLIESIKIIDLAVEKTILYKGPLTLVSDFIFSSNRDLNSYILLQRQLEELASNDLFIKSAELSLIRDMK